MAQQETETGAKDHHTQHDHIDDDEVSELPPSSSFYTKVREQAERFASTRLGQFVIERVDRGLKLLEDTTKWSLPQDKNSSGVVLERPLPWAPFLLLIVMLRLARIWVSLGALMIGNGPVTPSDMIYFIQTRRRKLRAIRVHGLRVMRHRQQETTSVSGKSFTQQLSQWLSRAICRPGVQRANSGRAFNVRCLETQQQQSSPHNQSAAKRPRDEDSNLTIDQMLSKYANENSEDDSDFVPNEEQGSATSNTSSSSSEESESESNSSERISSNEEQSNADQQKEEQSKMNHNSQQHKNPATTNGSNGNSEQTEVAAAGNSRVLHTGSPGASFSSSIGTAPVLKHAIVNKMRVHSTPNSEDTYSDGSEREEPIRQTISHAQPVELIGTPEEKPFKQQQQHQRQFNSNPHQRFRGRNRR